MNFLAHAHLSFNNTEILIGNLIADSVKGKPSETYSKDIRIGISLHRAIDHFTDNHEVYKQSLYKIRPTYMKFSGIIMDIYYDHFLASLWQNYSELPLDQFAAHCYQTLYDHYAILPERSQYILPFMKKQNWFVAYANMAGLQKVFDGMSKRIVHPTMMENSLTELQLHYSELQEEFQIFFPELTAFAKTRLEFLRENAED